MSADDRYEIVATATFENQAREIMWYLFEVGGSLKPAESFLEEIEQAKERLARFPYMGRMARSAALSRRGYRVLALKNHVIVYIVDDARRRVMLYGVSHQRREYEALL